MTAIPATRVLDGQELPAAGTYTLDPAHSTVGFIARHLVFTKVRGRFTDFDATVHIAGVPSESSVEATIKVASIDTGQSDRDAHLLSDDFFDAEHYPTITFKSTGVQPAGGSAWKLSGDLTIRDVTKPVTLDLELQGALTDPFGNDKALFEATTEVDREEFGLTYNQVLESGGVMVSKKIRIELEIQAVRQ